jgi:hypothetical protein
MFGDNDKERCVQMALIRFRNRHVRVRRLFVVKSERRRRLMAVPDKTFMVGVCAEL